MEPVLYVFTRLTEHDDFRGKKIYFYFYNHFKYKRGLNPDKNLCMPGCSVWVDMMYHESIVAHCKCTGRQQQQHKYSAPSSPSV